MEPKAFQDYYKDHTSHCYGCGRLNQHGLQIKSYWDGDETVCTFTPKSFQTSFPGYAYGGLIASVIDCHGTGSAMAAAYRAQGREMGTDPEIRGSQFEGDPAAGFFGGLAKFCDLLAQ